MRADTRIQLAHAFSLSDRLQWAVLIALILDVYFPGVLEGWGHHHEQG